MYSMTQQKAGSLMKLLVEGIEITCSLIASFMVMAFLAVMMPVYIAVAFMIWISEKVVKNEI